MRLFAAKAFSRFQRRERITDQQLCLAIRDAERGLVDADLGGEIFKLRVARTGQGKRGGFRIIIAYRVCERVFFLFGFAKSDRDNIGNDELVVLKERGGKLLSGSDDDLEALIADDVLREVYCASEDQN